MNVCVSTEDLMNEDMRECFFSAPFNHVLARTHYVRIHTYMHPYIHTYVHTVHTYILSYIHTYVHISIHGERRDGCVGAQMYS